MKKALLAFVAAVIFAALCWVFPPFHIRSLGVVRQAELDAVFNPTNFVEKFWSEKLLPAAGHATKATEVVKAIAVSPQKAHEQFGRSVGVSSSYFFFLSGTGRVVSVSDDSIGLSLNNEGNAVDISVPLGPLFGHAVRDGTGLLNISDYPNGQEFNDISAVLNNVIETQVLPGLKQMAKMGAHISFVGCAEVEDEDSDLKPLKLVPISVKVE
jgi:predicted lipoprotein